MSAPDPTPTPHERLGASAQSGLVAVVEDDVGIRELIEKLLRREGFEVMAFDGSKGLMAANMFEKLDCLILDLMLPGEDGLAICHALRARWPRLPILIVTARDDPMDRVIGLELGADDYLTKPFNSRELLARLRSVIRRTREVYASGPETGQDNFRFDGWLLRTGARDLTDPQGQQVNLTTGDFDLLHAFVLHPQMVLSREFLLDRTRGGAAELVDRVIDVQVARLRRKLGDEGRESRVIRTVRGDGYLFSPAVIRC